MKARPALTLGDTITVSASPGAISFALSPAALVAGSSPVSITVSYSGVSLLSNFTLYGYFASAGAALTGGSPVSNIPSSAVLGQVPTGTPSSFTAFTQTGPFGAAGASLLLYQSSSIVSLSGSRTDSLSLEINLASLPQLPAATYSGALSLQVQAF